MLEELDKKFFLLINSCHSPFWDNVMWFMSEKYVWIPLYVAIAIFLGIKYKRKVWMVLLFFALTILLSDQISVKCFKYVFCRLRPCHEPSFLGTSGRRRAGTSAPIPTDRSPCGSIRRAVTVWLQRRFTTCSWSIRRM